MKYKIVYVLALLVLLSSVSLSAQSLGNPGNVLKPISLVKVGYSPQPTGGRLFSLSDDSEVLFEAQLTDEAIVVSCQNAESDVRIVITSHSGLVYADTLVGSEWIEISTEGWSTDSYTLYVYYEDELWLGEFQL